MSPAVIVTTILNRSAPDGDIPTASSVPLDIQSIAVQALAADPIFRSRLTLCAIQIEVEGDRLVLSGHLPSFYLKQRLQEVVRHLDGVRDVENLVEVAMP
ncbi:BON domain-containing protein [Anatilimnocola sp. NA78]|uniref:BON domain-containing protein n=1 Tax=Anatilimnocola sp. NA78 TaxID=3415683 RepID=UPI003CE4D5B1